VGLALRFMGAGEPYAPGVLSRNWRETLQAAGIRHVKLHAAWIGHKDASLTMKLYAHSQDDALKAAGATSNRVVTSRDTDAR
jgi:integrase